MYDRRREKTLPDFYMATLMFFLSVSIRRIYLQCLQILSILFKKCFCQCETLQIFISKKIDTPLAQLKLS
jgi:hypothetical protein